MIYTLCILKTIDTLFMDNPILRSTLRRELASLAAPSPAVEMIVAKIFAINKVAGCRKDDRARDAHAIQNTIVRFWQTHNLLQSKNINDTLLPQPLSFFSLFSFSSTLDMRNKRCSTIWDLRMLLQFQSFKLTKSN